MNSLHFNRLISLVSFRWYSTIRNELVSYRFKNRLTYNQQDSRQNTGSSKPYIGLPARILLYLTTFVPFLMCTFSAQGQYQIKGVIQDADELSLAFANVLLRDLSNPDFISGGISEENGSFSIIVNKEGPFRLDISVLGYEDYQSDSLVLNTENPVEDLGVIILNEMTEQLEGVTVIGTVPLFERKIDRTVVNIANRINTAGSSALEILEKSPGVVVNRQGNSIAMLGKSGVNVMVNGKLQYMPSDALFSFLQGLDASNIQSLELITTPPANFDAQGNAGYINIVMKTNPNEGLNGNYAFSAGYGGGEVGSASINFNYRSNVVNLFGGYSYLRNGQDQNTQLYRKTGSGNSFMETTLHSDRHPTQNNHTYRVGLDLQITKKTTLGFLISGYNNFWDMNAVNTTIIHPISSPDTLAISRNSEINDWQHVLGNINLSHNFDSGAILNLDYDYLVYDNQNPILYDLAIQDEDGTVLEETELESSKSTPFNILVGNIDYSLPLNEKVKVSLGTKYVISEFKNDIALNEDGILVPDFTSTSNLKERIFAFYTKVDYQPNEKTTLNAGLRYEKSDTDLNSTNGGQVVDRNLKNFFPSVFWNQKLSDFSSFNLSYSRRINRPSFSDMAPFVIFLDPRTSFGGNAALRPSLAHAFELSISRRQLNVTAQYSDEDFTIVSFQNRYDPATNTQLIVPDNLAKQKTASLSLSFPVKMAEWWMMRYFSTFLWQESTTSEDLGEFTFNQNNFRLNGTQTLTIRDDLSLEFSGYYQTRSLIGNVKFEPIALLDFGIQKTFKNGSRLTFNINDLFNSLKMTGITDISEEDVYIKRQRDFSHRTFKLTYSATFGNRKLSEERERKSGAEEELKRVN